MDTYSEVNCANWERKKLFDLFDGYDDPFFNITANIEIGNLPVYCKNNGLSFNLTTIFISQKVINTIPELKMRIAEDSVRLYEKVNCGSTIFMPDKTFSFCYYPFNEDLKLFDKKGKADINKLKDEGGFDPRHDELNLIYYSTIPWVKFTSIKHPRRDGKVDSIPKIVLGKWFEENGKYFLPLSAEAHHGLVDGYHIGLYFNGMEEEFKKLTAQV